MQGVLHVVRLLVVNPNQSMGIKVVNPYQSMGIKVYHYNLLSRKGRQNYIGLSFCAAAARRTPPCG